MKIPKLLLAIGVAGFAIAQSQAQTFMNTDVGNPGTDPVLAGDVVDNGDGTLTITGGGSDIWNNSDAFHYYYTTVQGAFDAWIRVESLEGPDNWTKCELMARWPEGTTPAGPDPHVSNMTTRSAGQNEIQPQWRNTRSGGSGNLAVGLAPTYPNTWLRLRRVGQMWEMYHSTDGSTWGDPFYTHDTSANPWPDTILVGIAVTSHNNASDAALGEAVVTPVTFNVAPTMTATANAIGFTANVFDSGQEQVTGITQVLLDGNDVTSATTDSKTGGTTTINYDIFADTGGYFESGSTHSLEVSYDSNTGGGSLTVSFTVAAYNVVPPELAIANPPSVDFSGEMMVYVVQSDTARTPTANSLSGYEEQLAGAMRDASGNIRPNVANQSEPQAIDDRPLDINYNVLGGTINATDPQPDNFYDGDYINNSFDPFIIAEDANLGENFTAEFYGWIQLDEGFYRMGVNSDDGFKFSIGKGPRDVFGMVLGQFDGGRGAADTLFDFRVEESGVYPFRLVWGQGGGGGNCEWFNVVDLATGELRLINDPLQNPIFGGTWTDSLYTWAEGGSARASVTRFVPANGYQGVYPEDSIEWEITNGTTSAVAGQTRLIVDGVEVISGGGATGNYTPEDPWQFGSQHTGQFIWVESPDIEHVQDFSFTVRTEGLQDLGIGFFIEAEDYDYNGGQHLPAASDMTSYTGGGYQRTDSAVYPAQPGVDMSTNTDDTLDGGAWVYRATSTNDLWDPNDIGHQPDATVPNTPINRDRKAGDTVITLSNDWKLGWMGGSRWFNYTRNVPPGIYKAFGVFSQDAESTLIGGDFGIVTAGQGTSTQTVRNLGSFAALTDDTDATWGGGVWCPLRTAFAEDAPQAFFKLTESTTTFRVTSRNGDFHHIQLAQAAPGEVFPPSMRRTLPAAMNFALPRNPAFSWTVEEFTSGVDQDSITLMFGPQGAMADVSADLDIVQNNDLWSIGYTPSSLLMGRTTYEFELSVSDDAPEPTTLTDGGTFLTSYLPSDSGTLATEGYFLIEAEDYNTGGGQIAGDPNTMPYLGGAYSGLDAVMGIDYSRDDNVTDANAHLYRTWDTNSTPAGVPPAIKVENNAGTLRNVRDMTADGTITWNVEANYAVGWSGSVPNRWFNYTREIPAGTYQIWAGMAVDQTGAGTMRSILDQVVSGATTPNQVVNPLGVFNGGGTGTWGDTVLVPLLDNATDRNIKEVTFAGGATTLRWTLDSGDQDYLMLVPTEATGAPIITDIGVTPGGDQLTIEWLGDGMLQSTPSIPAETWTDETGTSPATINVPGSGSAYYRVMAP